jgi:hypothetical protein
MLLPFLLLLIFQAIASPIESDEVRLRSNREKLVKALRDFGNRNFTWPALYLVPVYHPALHVDEASGAEEDIALNTGFIPPSIQSTEEIVEEPDAELEEIETGYATEKSEGEIHAIPEDNPVLDLPAEAPVMEYSARKPEYTLHHSSNDDPADLEEDIYLITEREITGPICILFQHSVLGDDFGESTFPRVSYVGSEPLPFRVHYAPDDDLRFEAYKWPFSACNHACELQALRIRALFDWELDPLNEESDLDDETKFTLLTAREICQWKNVHYHFAIDDDEDDRVDLKKRNVSMLLGNKTSTSPSFATPPIPNVDLSPLEAQKAAEPQLDITGPSTQLKSELYLSDGARSAVEEIRNIFVGTKGPSDLAQMFHTVIVACQIHRYTSTPMLELEMSSTDHMLEQAMGQIGRVFAETQGRIDVWETRDAIVRATQIYRYQEEQG